MNGPSTSPFLSLSRGSQRNAIRGSYKEDFQTLDKVSSPFTPSELRLPSEDQPAEAKGSLKEETRAKDAFPGTTDRVEARPDGIEYETLGDVISAAIKAVEGLTVAQLAIYGGVTAGGLYLMESILNSLEVLPLFSEAMQLIGVLYAVLLSSRIFQGKPLSFTPSPVKAIIDLVERGDTKIQRTSLTLPQDLDVQISAKLEKLAKERDDAVNEMEDLRRTAVNYARVVAEKEALEAVAMQLAKERDEAISEVTALKKAVDAMSDRMRAIEKMLEEELQPLKENTRALETVALQLASERDSALKEVSELREVVALAKGREEEKKALESLASQLAKEKDQALFENENLKKILANLQMPGAKPSGLDPEQEHFLKAHIGAAGPQHIDLDKQYDDQKDVVDKFVSHLVDEYGAPPDWTTEYVKQILDASRSETVVDIPFSSSQSEAEKIL